MRFLALPLLFGCFEADRTIVHIDVDARSDTVRVREDLDNVWADSVDCEASLAECVEGVRKALKPEDSDWKRSWARVEDGSLDIGFEGDFPAERLSDLGIVRIPEARPHREVERWSMLVTPELGSSAEVAGRFRRFDYHDGDAAKQLWVLYGRKHTVTLTTLATEEGKVVTTQKWVTPEIEQALRGAQLLER